MTDTPIIAAARALVILRSGADDYDTLGEALQLALQEEVRVVLRAVRDPSEGMKEAGTEVVSSVHEGESEIAYESDAANTWRFMIDAAIAE